MDNQTCHCSKYSRQNFSILRKIPLIQKVKDKTVRYSFLRCKVLMASVHAYISTGTQPPKHNGFKYLLNKQSYIYSCQIIDTHSVTVHGCHSGKSRLQWSVVFQVVTIWFTLRSTAGNQPFNLQPLF